MSDENLKNTADVFSFNGFNSHTYKHPGLEALAFRKIFLLKEIPELWEDVKRYAPEGEVFGDSKVVLEYLPHADKVQYAVMGSYFYGDSCLIGSPECLRMLKMFRQEEVLNSALFSEV